MKYFTICIMISILFLMQGCRTEHKVDMNTTHKVELEVKPMHITIDINVKVDKALDDFFGDIDKQDQTMSESKTQEKPEKEKKND